MAEETAKSNDDNILAAIAHASIIFGAFIIPLVIWLTQKEKSKYVAFQALQAAVYQVLAVVGLAVLWFIGTVVIIILGLVIDGLDGPLMILMMLLFIPDIVVFLYGLYGAYMCYQGKDFKYVLIGNMLKK